MNSKKILFILWGLILITVIMASSAFMEQRRLENDLRRATENIRHQNSTRKETPMAFPNSPSLLEEVHQLARGSSLDVDALKWNKDQRQLMLAFTGSYLCFLDFLDALGAYSLRVNTVNIKGLQDSPCDVRVELALGADT